ncbi:MAG: PEGA domain-containing protein [Planctomycetota bacterium]
MSVNHQQQTEGAAATGGNSARRLSLLTALILLALPGCVHRRATIRTDPPGAQVLVGDREIGYSPASFDFTWYGTEEVTIRKDGYEQETRYVKLRRPWYQVPPVDFVTDHFLPGRVKDHQEFHFKLRPRQLVPANQLLERGNALRSEAQLTQ